MDMEPKIVAFCCSWCAYAAADLAGMARLQYPSQIRIIRVMCSGMVHPRHVLEAFSQGADGVMILGCHLGECHYRTGNYTALGRAEMISELLADFGYDKERFVMNWLSSAEPDAFVEMVRQLTEKILPPRVSSGE